MKIVSVLLDVKIEDLWVASEYKTDKTYLDKRYLVCKSGFIWCSINGLVRKAILKLYLKD